MPYPEDTLKINILLKYYRMHKENSKKENYKEIKQNSTIINLKQNQEVINK